MPDEGTRSAERAKSPEDDPLGALVARVDEIAAKLSSVAARIGYDGPRPDDPQKAIRWDVPLMWHLSDLRDSMHSRASAEHVLIGLIERLGGKLDRNASISQSNLEAISKVAENIHKIEVSAERIANNVGVVVREKPLLMRDIFWLETDAVEALLIVVSAGEAAVFGAASEKLIQSAVFNSMAAICPYPIAWSIGIGFLALGSALAWGSRRSKFRTAAVFCSAVYRGSVGFATLWFAPGVLGWLYHLAFFLASMWILRRGPSRAT